MNIDAAKLIEKIKNQRNANADEAAAFAAALETALAENASLKAKVEELTKAPAQAPA